MSRYTASVTSCPRCHTFSSRKSDTTRSLDGTINDEEGNAVMRDELMHRWLRARNTSLAALGSRLASGSGQAPGTGLPACSGLVAQGSLGAPGSGPAS